ncbi:MAG: YCF48-related protein [Saprospiraceae bacterium]
MKSPLLHLTLIAFSLCLFNSAHAQWTRQYPLPKLEDVLDIDVSTDGYGFAVGSNDLLLRTQAGNNAWELLPGYGEGWRFDAVDYLDGSGGSIAAAGGEGLILTVDKGDHWNVVSGAPAGINTIKIFSPTHLIVAADGGISSWTNGIWTNLNVGASAALKGAFIMNDQIMWAYTFATNPTIFYTTNGGANWNSNADVPRVDAVRFFDAENGTALDGRDVYQSTNGGQNWTLIAANGLINASNDLSYGTTANVLVAATLNAKPNISKNGGLTWNAITTSLVNQRSYSVSLVSDTDFWIGNDLSGVMHSTDGGATWAETSGPTRNLIQDVHFVNRNSGFAIGQKGLLLRTLDGGANWSDISFGIRSYLCIYGLTMNDLWIGTNQRILHSVNSGDTWTESVVFPAGNINDILAISHDRILAASTTGTIYLSKNAGMTWDSVYSSGLQMRSLAKIDDQHYMATGYNGVIVRSDDQGQTWHPVTIPEAGLQYEQSFFLNGEGWLITSSFKKAMWHTKNGGNTWDTLSLPIDRFWDGLYFITKDTGVIVGRSATEGRAYLTFDGGHHWQSGYITTFPLFGATGFPNPNGTAWIYGYGSDIENLKYCNSLPVISNFVGNLNPCEKDTVTYSLSSQNIDLFTWHFPPGWQVIGNANNDTIQVIPGLSSGNITVLGSNTCGETGQLSYSATPHKLPVLLNIGGDQVPCPGSIISYSASQLNVDNYEWTLPSDWAIQGNANLPSIMVQVGSLSGNVSLVGSNICGLTDKKDLFVTPFPAPVINAITGNLSPCRGDTVNYQIESNDLNDTYIITSVNGLNDWSMLGSNFLSFVAGNEPGTIAITAVNSCNTTSVPYSLNLNPIYVPDVGILAVGNKLYPTSLGTSYQWYVNGVAIAGAAGDSLSPVVGGTYTVLVTFDTGCSRLSLSVEVVISGTKVLSNILPVSVYPVPTSDQLFIKGIEGSFNYIVYDLIGNKILSDQSATNKIPISTLSPGMYVLKIEKESTIYMAKFIRN